MTETIVLYIAGTSLMQYIINSMLGISKAERALMIIFWPLMSIMFFLIILTDLLPVHKD